MVIVLKNLFMKKSVFASFGTALLVPALALAQFTPVTTTGTPNTAYVDTWLTKAIGWLSQSITIIMVLMTVWFLINVFRYVQEKDPGELKDKRKTMVSGLVGLFIAVSVWGIIQIAGSVFGTRNATTPGLTCPPGTQVDSTGNCRIPTR